MNAKLMFQAVQAVFECQECPGRLRPDFSDAPDTDEGFRIPTLTCEKCGAVVTNDEDTLTLLGL